MIFLGIKYHYSPIIDITKVLPCIPFNIWHTTLSFFMVLELSLFLQMLINQGLPFKLHCHFIPIRSLRAA